MTGGEPSAHDPEIGDYLRNAFMPAAARPLPDLPLPEESNVGCWREWLEIEPTSERLVKWLPQLALEVREGVSRSTQYKSGILGGELELLPDPAGFSLHGSFQVSIEGHWSGNLPVITLTDRADFEHFFQCLGNHGEPIDISPQAHALMVIGLVSPRKVHAARSLWDQGLMKDDPRVSGCANWSDAMRALDSRDKCFFRDQVLLTHVDRYAGLDSDQVGHGLTPERWLEVSRVIRLNHEFTHHATRRLFENMRLNLHDEIIADCIGFLAGLGCFDSNVFLMGLGIDPDGGARPDGRVRMYVRGLGEDEVRTVCGLTVSAARNLEAWLGGRDSPAAPQLTRALARLSLEDLAGFDASMRIDATMAV
ncbi:MAG: hypothetical protein P8J45_04220 [Phycisphaerales bacterium]|jgi:hypothetical protein|nr:hypothetical protein [Phycisphaerales bacterium]